MSTRLRLVTYNTHHGECVDGRFELERLAAIIRSLDPDLVGLQEVDNLTVRSGNVDQARVLGELTGMRHAFGRAMDFDGGEYGEAVLSRWPILSVANHPLPHIQGTEPRAALEVRVVAGDGGPEVTFISTHLEHTSSDTDRIAAARYLNHLYDSATQSPPTFLAGDLNATPDSEPIRILREQWMDPDANRSSPTFPCANPQRKLDYILIRPNPRVSVVESRVIHQPAASDHCPLLLAVELL
jgi:endonuclease/exonuclease/phosphatase family metal-dependent hydrolase